MSKSVNQNKSVTESVNKPDSTTIFPFLSFIGPYVLIGFFALMSLFNFNFKGVIYIIGVILLLVLASTICGIYGGEENTTEDASKFVCTIFGIENGLFENVPFGVLVYTYTFIYLLLPMIQTSSINYPMLISLMLIGAVEVVVQSSNGCVNFLQLVITIICSIIFGFMWSAFILSVEPDLLYHTDFTSDRAVCSMPSEQKFKCKVYKNGELITTMTK